MHILSSHRGANRPFERDRSLSLGCIPVGASIQSAVATVTPVSTDEDRLFIETVDFNGIDDNWGAVKRDVDSGVEVDFHARRKLAGVVGFDLDGAILQVDLGGGFTAVDANGGLGGDTTYDMTSNDQALPGLTVAGLRLTPDGTSEAPDISRLRVASAPSNVTMAIEGGPVFWAHFGDLVQPVTSPDFTELLQEALDQASVEHEHHRISFVVHSDSIARVDVELDIDYLLEKRATPSGVDQVSLPFEFGTTAEGGSAALALSIPSGSVAAPGATGGRVQGSFAPSQVVLGPTGQVETDGLASIAPSSSQAQPFSVPEATLASSVDALVAAVTASADLAVDIVGDLDGKPDQISLLSEVATRQISRDDAPDLTWLNVPLPHEVELHPETTYWLVVHARQGRVDWGSKTGDNDSPSLQTTTDNGLSWRSGGSAATAAQLRLRHSTPSFQLPLELRVDAGAGPVGVDLDRFASSGRVDFSLDFDEVGEAMNTALGQAGVDRLPNDEHIANGDFEHWFRLGSGPRLDSRIAPPDEATPITGAFSPDGNCVYLVTSSESGNRLEAWHTYCRTRRFSVGLPSGRITAMIVDGTDSRAVVATEQFDVIEPSLASASEECCDDPSIALTVLDLVRGCVIGKPISSEDMPIVDLALVPDGSGLYVLGSQPEASIVARLDWALMVALAERRVSDPRLALQTIDGGGLAIAVGPGGNVFVTSQRPTPPGPGVESAPAPGPGTIQGFDAELSAEIEPLPFPSETIAGPQHAEFASSGRRLVVMSRAEVASIDVERGEATVLSNGETTFRGLASDPLDDSMLIVTNGPVLRLDHATKRLEATGLTVRDALAVAISPPGNRLLVTARQSEARLVRMGEDLPADWELTAGRVTPTCFGDPARPVATLGERTTVDPLVVHSAAMSQVVPVAPSTRYRFAFEALADLAGATAEILWRTADCGSERIDVVDIDSLETRPTGLGGLTHHELDVVAPGDAVSAEVRFQVPEDQLHLTGVALAGSNDAVANSSLQSVGGAVQGWDGSTPQITAGSGASSSTVIASPSTGGAQLAQLVPVTGARYELRAEARVIGDREGAAIVVDFLTEIGVDIGEPVQLPVEPLAFDCVVAAGDVPDGATDARLSILIPPAAELEIDRLSLEFHDPVPVSIEFVSEAPGELLVSEVVVGVDEAPTHRPSVPQDGLCPSTPPSVDRDDEAASCHCPACGKRTPVGRSVAIFTPEGRPGSVSTCQSCGGPRLSIGGRLVAEAESTPFLPFTVIEPGEQPVKITPRLAVRGSIEDVSGISAGRAAALRELGIHTLGDLAAADPTVVASIRGISITMANDFMSQARDLIRRHGRRVLVDHDGETIIDESRVAHVGALFSTS